MAGNPYIQAGFASVRGGGGARRETFDSMFDGAASAGLATAIAPDFWGHAKAPASVGDLARAKAVDYGDMHATIADGGDQHDYEIGVARLVRNRGQKKAREISAAGKDPAQIALFAMRDGMIPEERSIRPHAQRPRPIGRV